MGYWTYFRFATRAPDISSVTSGCLDSLQAELGIFGVEKSAHAFTECCIELFMTQLTELRKDFAWASTSTPTSDFSRVSEKTPWSSQDRKLISVLQNIITSQARNLDDKKRELHNLKKYCLEARDKFHQTLKVKEKQARELKKLSQECEREELRQTEKAFHLGCHVQKLRTENRMYREKVEHLKQKLLDYEREGVCAEKSADDNEYLYQETPCEAADANASKVAAVEIPTREVATEEALAAEGVEAEDEEEEISGEDSFDSDKENKDIEVYEDREPPPSNRPKVFRLKACRVTYDAVRTLPWSVAVGLELETCTRGNGNDVVERFASMTGLGAAGGARKLFESYAWYLRHVAPEAEIDVKNHLADVALFCLDNPGLVPVPYK